MSVDFELEELNDNIADLVEEYLTNKIAEMREKLRGHTLSVQEGWGGIRIFIEGNIIYAHLDKSMHRWHFRDENFSEFYETSEKKGEEIIKFLQTLAKVLSPRERAESEENLGKGPLDPAAESEEIIAGNGRDAMPDLEEGVKE